MLVDTEFNAPDPVTMFAVSIISSDSIMPRNIGTGLYQVGHWNVEDMHDNVWSWKDEDYNPWERGWPETGVCDYPDQVIEKYPEISNSDDKFFITFVPIRKIDQPSSGGWRWHKWGEYVGDKEPKCEYLFDESDDIQEVYTFHVYQLKNITPSES